MRAVIALLTMVVSLIACADEKVTPPAFKEGVDYQVLSQPVRTRNSNKIEVTEVFWYGCGHCFTFEPMVHQWQKQQADDVDFQQSPVTWNAAATVHARAFYTARALGVMDKLHQPIFNALNLERKKLANIDSLADFFVQHGVDREKFIKTYNSFGVDNQVKQADSRARGYKITGTPELIVDGKYRVSARTAGSQAKMLQVVDYLIATIRAGK